MANPLIAVMRQYERVPISAVIIELAQQGGGLRVQIIRSGGSSGQETETAAPQSPDPIAEMRWRMGLGPEPQREVYRAPPGVAMHIWEHLPDVWIEVAGEYYRHELPALVRAAAAYSQALDVMEVRDGPATRWHYRPCNPQHWTIHTLGNRSYRLPRNPATGPTDRSRS